MPALEERLQTRQSDEDGVPVVYWFSCRFPGTAGLTLKNFDGECS